MPGAFRPDGSKLVALGTKGTVLVWHLRLVREQLAAMGLDWEQPREDEKPRPPDRGRLPPLEVPVVGEIPEPKAAR